MTKAKTLIITVFMTVISLGAMAQSLQDAGTKFEEARALLSQKKIPEAIPLLEQTIEIADGLEDEKAMQLSEAAKKILAQVYLANGVNLVRAKKIEAGLEELKKAEQFAIAHGQGNVRRKASRMVSLAYMAMGIEAFNSGDFNKSLEIFKTGYEADKRNVELALYTAKSYAELGQLDKATPLFNQVIDVAKKNSKYDDDAKTAKDDISTYYLLAASKQAEANNLDEVIKIADQVIALDPNNDAAHFLPIQLANNLKKYDVVIARGDVAAEAQKNPETKSEIYLLLGVAYQNIDNKEKALENLKKVMVGAKVIKAKAIIVEINK